MGKIVTSIFGAVLILTSIALMTFGALYTKISFHQHVADHAALVAADAARNLREGAPCDLAAQIAAINETTLSSCTIGSDSVQIVISFEFFFHRIGCVAVAGPPV